MDGQRDQPVSQTSRHGEASDSNTEPVNGGLVRTQRRVVTAHGNPPPTQPLSHLSGVSVDHLHREQMPSGGSRRGLEGTQRSIPKCLQVASGYLLASGESPIETRQQSRAKYRRLHLIKSTVEAHLGMLVLGNLAIVAKGTGPLGEDRIEEEYHAPVTQGAEVLRRVEARGGDGSCATRGPTVAMRSGRLSAVLDHGHVVRRREALQPAGIKGVAIQVDRHHSAYRGVLAKCPLRKVEVQATGFIDVAPDRLATGTENGQRRRKSRERGRQHPGATVDASAAQTYLERVETARNADRMRCPPPPSELALKLPYLLAEDQPSAAPHAIDRRQGVVAHFVPLTSEIVCRDVEKRAVSHVRRV